MDLVRPVRHWPTHPLPSRNSLCTTGSLPERTCPGREAGHSAPFSAKVKEVWSYTSTSNYAFIACAGTSLPLSTVTLKDINFVKKSLLSATLTVDRICNVQYNIDHEGESGNVEFSESCWNTGK